MQLSHSITLLSDLGVRDTTVAIAKTILLRHVTGVTIADISHNVAQYDLQQAAYLLLSAYSHFPAGAIHIISVDVFAVGISRMLLATKDGYVFIAPDNGILPLAFGTSIEGTKLCFELGQPYTFNEWMNKAGSVAKQVMENNTSHFAPCDVKEAPRILQPRILPDGVECNILYVDRYENIVLDITRTQFDTYVKGRSFKIKLLRVGDITTISNTYNDVAPGEPLSRFNSTGFLEIAFNHAPAATSLGFGSFSTGNLRYQTIKLEF